VLEIALLTPRGSGLLASIDRANSITAYEDIKFSRIFKVKSSARDYPALKEKSKTSLEKSVHSSSDWSE
jgi:hypothetical protein